MQNPLSDQRGARIIAHERAEFGPERSQVSDHYYSLLDLVMAMPNEVDYLATQTSDSPASYFTSQGDFTITFIPEDRHLRFDSEERDKNAEKTGFIRRFELYPEGWFRYKYMPAKSESDNFFGIQHTEQKPMNQKVLEASVKRMTGLVDAYKEFIDPKRT